MKVVRLFWLRCTLNLLSPPIMMSALIALLCNQLYFVAKSYNVEIIIWLSFLSSFF